MTTPPIVILRIQFPLKSATYILPELSTAILLGALKDADKPVPFITFPWPEPAKSPTLFEESILIILLRSRSVIYIFPAASHAIPVGFLN